ncbi:MAG: hypothetical protein PVG41_02975 [Desulfobacteraceae bacterium]
MFQFVSFRSVALMLTAFVLLAMPLYATAQDAQQKAPRKKGLQQRIDFGSSYILGQSIKSGAVYLMHRKQSDIKGMLEVRQDYRQEIMEDYELEKTVIAQEAADQKKEK